MSPRDPKRAQNRFAMDESLGKVLGQWAKERDSDIGRMNLARAASKMSIERKAVLCARLAEISLAMLFVLEEESGRSTVD